MNNARHVDVYVIPAHVEVGNVGVPVVPGKPCVKPWNAHTADKLRRSDNSLPVGMCNVPPCARQRVEFCRKLSVSMQDCKHAARRGHKQQATLPFRHWFASKWVLGKLTPNHGIASSWRTCDLAIFGRSEL